MSLALATKGVIAYGVSISVTITGPPETERVYLIEMNVDVDISPLSVVADFQDFLVGVSLDRDFDVAIDIDEDG